MHQKQNPNYSRRRRGFERASGLLQGQIGRVGATRGFAVSRLFTRWAEIVGSETAGSALPVKVSYAQGGFGATLTVLTTGAQAPMLQAELPKIKDKVNACYGYAAIARVRITQTSAIGFSEGQVAFAAKTPRSPVPDLKATAAAKLSAKDVVDASLRIALEELGSNVLSRPKR